jgi:hypothetical protein
MKKQTEGRDWPRLTKKQVLAYYGTAREAADAIGITSQSIYNWDEFVPELAAYRFHLATDGELYHPEIDWKAVDGGGRGKRRRRRSA